MRSMQWQLGILGTITAFAYRHRETRENLCRGGRSTNIRKRQLMKRLLNKNIFICVAKDSYQNTEVTCTNIASGKRLTLR